MMPFCHTNLFYKLIIFQELFLIFTKLSLMHRDKKINYIALNAKSKREVYNVLHWCAKKMAPVQKK